MFSSKGKKNARQKVTEKNEFKNSDGQESVVKTETIRYVSEPITTTTMEVIKSSDHYEAKSDIKSESKMEIISSSTESAKKLSSSSLASATSSSLLSSTSKSNKIGFSDGAGDVISGISDSSARNQSSIISGSTSSNISNNTKNIISNSNVQKSDVDITQQHIKGNKSNVTMSGYTTDTIDSGSTFTDTVTGATTSSSSKSTATFGSTREEKVSDVISTNLMDSTTVFTTKKFDDKFQSLDVVDKTIVNEKDTVGFLSKKMSSSSLASSSATTTNEKFNSHSQNQSMTTNESNMNNITNMSTTGKTSMNKKELMNLNEQQLLSSSIVGDNTIINESVGGSSSISMQKSSMSEKMQSTQSSSTMSSSTMSSSTVVNSSQQTKSSSATSSSAKKSSMISSANDTKQSTSNLTKMAQISESQIFDTKTNTWRTYDKNEKHHQNIGKSSLLRFISRENDGTVKTIYKRKEYDEKTRKWKIIDDKVTYDNKPGAAPVDIIDSNSNYTVTTYSTKIYDKNTDQWKVIHQQSFTEPFAIVGEEVAREIEKDNPDLANVIATTEVTKVGFI